jgi:hypothetical protein
MLKSARRSAEEWKAIIEDFLKSGMLQKDYAGEHELIPSCNQKADKVGFF